MVVAGGPSWGSEVCPDGVVAGRVAVVLGGDVVCAVAAELHSTLVVSNTASTVKLGFMKSLLERRDPSDTGNAIYSAMFPNELISVIVCASLFLVSQPVSLGFPGHQM